MPGRLRQSGRTSTAAAEAGPYNIPGLEFNEALTWRAGKPIAVADLLDRLQNLSTELRNVEQGVIPATEFTKLAQDLANANLIGHKDKGVRAWTLCCIVDILNICAPDAPFRPAQLKDIFTVAVNSILPTLADPSNAYNSQHVYILNNLVEFKSIVLITDIQDADSLIVTLFSICFDIVSGSGKATAGVDLAKSVEFQLQAMLITIVDEANLPQEAVDTIISQFLRVDPGLAQDKTTNRRKTDSKDKSQGTLMLKDYPPAYHMAKAVCTTCSEKMTGYISQYFGSVIMNATASLGQDERPTKQHRRRVSDASDSDDDDNESLNDLRKAHKLVRELWRACPDVLLNVIPQIEAELGADSQSIRQVATETLGDMIAGIGISGPPPTTVLDPSDYPLPTIEAPKPNSQTSNPLLLPLSPKPFAHVHGSAYSSFLRRRVDKAPSVRIAWAIAASRILLTNAGGIGLGSEEHLTLLGSLASLLRDIDEKVRFSTIRSISAFDYYTVINELGQDGGMSSADSFFSILAERVTDKKHQVREEAMLSLGRIWGVASRDLESGVEKVVSTLGDIPSRLFAAMYTNDPLISILLDKVLYESLLPLSYPPTKTKPSVGKKQSQRDRATSQEPSTEDPDALRVLRILTLVRGLDDKAKPIFFGIQKRQAQLSKAVMVFLKACEEYNGGILDDKAQESQKEEQLKKYIDQLSRAYPDQSKASSDLWKFAKAHDRRNYQLVRFAMGPEHDFRTMTKAIKELTKRLRENSPSTLETITQLLYRCALVIYNRSHVPAIMEATRSGDASTAEAAHEVLREISTQNPEVLKSQIQALCKELEETAPSKGSFEPASAPDSLKACAAFARKYPAEMSKDRKFLQAMISFALHSKSPLAAKHAVTIALTISDKKEMHAKEILSKAVKACRPQSATYLAELAAIAQVCLLAPHAASTEEDRILQIAVRDTLHKNQSPSRDKYNDTAWEDPQSEETIAKDLALKILVNRCRSGDDKGSRESFDTLANSVLTILMHVIAQDGEITPSQNTPSGQRNRLRLAAVKFILKLCSHKRRFEELVTPTMFNSLALIMINPPYWVRAGLIGQIRKYLGRNELNPRWYAILFMLAFEPTDDLKNSTSSWLKSRVAFFARQQKQAQSSANTQQLRHQNVMELVFARLLSLLAHHPDYPDTNSENFDGDLLDFANYIVFYLRAVATEENLSLIFHIAQRVKQTQDAITLAASPKNSSAIEDANERLYVLSDLAQATIRNYADMMPVAPHARGTNLLQTWPGKIHLPTTLFAALPNHAKAQEVVEKNYLPEDVAMGLEALVKKSLRSSTKSGPSKTKAAPGVNGTDKVRKRKSSDVVDVDDDDEDEDEGERKSTKKVKKEKSLPIRRTPKQSTSKRKIESSIEQPSRKSARVNTGRAVNYAESDEENGNQDDAVNNRSPLSRKGKTTTFAATKALSESEAEDENVEMNGQDESAGSGEEDQPDEDIDAIEEELQDTDVAPQTSVKGGRSPRKSRNSTASRGTKATKTSVTSTPASSTKKNVKELTEKSPTVVKAKGKPRGKATVSDKSPELQPTTASSSDLPQRRSSRRAKA